MSTTTRRATLAAVTLLASSLALTACGSDSLDTPGTSGTAGSANASSSGGSDPTAAAKAALDKVTKDDALAAKVPAALKSAGTIKVGSDASYAPVDFIAEDGKTLIGIDMDLFTAVSKKLGLTPQFENAEFSSIILNVNSGKYDVGTSAFTINEERKKQVNMVQYFNAGVQWAVPKGNPKKVSLDNVCGLTVGVQKGTVEVDDLNKKSKACTDAGKPAINQVVEVEQSKVTVDLVSGKVDAMTADSPITAYAIALQGDKIEKLGDLYDAAPYGFVVPKDQTDLADAISGALTALKQDGTYDAVLEKWGVKDAGVDQFPVNP